MKKAALYTVLLTLVLLLAACTVYPPSSKDIVDFPLTITYENNVMSWDTSIDINDLTHDIYLWSKPGVLFNVYEGVKANQPVNARVDVSGSPYIFVGAFKDGVAKAEAFTYLVVKSGKIGAVSIQMKKLGTAQTPGNTDPGGNGGNGATQTPTADDFTYGNLAQVVGSVSHVTVTPKPDKSGGAITRYYEGTSPVTAKSTTPPTTVGTYAVTFDVAASGTWKAAAGLSAGTLVVVSSSANIINVDSSNWSSFTDQITASTDAANPNYYVVNITEDITAPNVYFETPNSTGLNLTIDGGGHTINITNPSNVLLYSWSGHTVTMNNLNVKRTGGSTSTLTVSYGTLVMNNCTITGGTTNSGGVYVTGGGTFTMNGGTISGLTNSNNSGGGVSVNSGTFNMLGGEIFGNAVYGGGGGVAVLSGGTFRIVTGTIYGNNEGALSNTASMGGHAITSGGTAQYGTFAVPGDTNSAWIGTDIIASGSDLDDTLEVLNGYKIRPQP